MRYQDYVFQVPEEKVVRLITDTDAKNEADDDFAVVQALLSPKIENVGLVGPITALAGMRTVCRKAMKNWSGWWLTWDLPDRCRCSTEVPIPCQIPPHRWTVRAQG